ncbi:hypothetical protein [Sessilibacter corallicola]
MPYTYKDLTYIRTALQVYEAKLVTVEYDDCEDNEFSEIQDDIQYLQRLLALTDKEIKTLENSGPSLNPV